MHIHCFGLFYFCLTFSHIPIYLFTLRWEILVHETSLPLPLFIEILVRWKYFLFFLFSKTDMLHKGPTQSDGNSLQSLHRRAKLVTLSKTIVSCGGPRFKVVMFHAQGKLKMAITMFDSFFNVNVITIYDTIFWILFFYLKIMKIQQMH